MEHLQQVFYHRLLARQLAKYLPEEWTNSDAFMPFLEAVNHAYKDFESDLRQLERTLELSTKESFKELKDLKEAIDAAAKVMLFDRTGHVRYTNEKLARLIKNIQMENKSGENVLLSDDQGLNEEIWKTINSGKIWSGEYSVCKSNGEKVWLKDTIVPFLNEQGFPTRFLSIKFNITDQINAQHELKKAQQLAEDALQSKSDFLSVMSHEIRTPLNAVIGIAQLLMEENPSPDQLEKLELLNFASENLLSLINNILDYNKLESGKIEIEKIPIDIRMLINNLVKSYEFKAKEKGVSLNFEADISGLWIKTDPTRLAQVVNNLIANAIKFTNQGSVTVWLTASKMQHDEVSISIAVADTGKGIAKENFSKIFQLFTQESSSISRNYGGTGLGLAISSKIASLMGGSIALESELNSGSKFTFSFKAGFVNANVSPFLSPQEKSHAQLLKLKVLVVDDNELNIFVARQILKKWACEVVEARSGEECLEKVSNSTFDVVLLDLQMPGMDGFQTMTALNQRNFQTPVIALTADSDTEIRKRVLESGIREVLLKPFSHQSLFDLLKSTISFT
jgi:PAS domain S-box-containing protein